MPEKDGDEGKSTKSVVNKKQKPDVQTEGLKKIGKNVKNFFDKTLKFDSKYSNEPSVRSGIRTPQSTHMFKHVPSVNKDGTTSVYGQKGADFVKDKLKKGSKSILSKGIEYVKNNPKQAGIIGAAAVGTGLAYAGIKGLQKRGERKAIAKSVVRQLEKKKMMGEEGYDIARDMGRVRPSKDKKDATSYPPSEEMKKLRKVNKGPSALERVKADIRKRGEKIMDVKKEELDLTQVAEALGGYIVEAPVDDPKKKKTIGSQKITDKNFDDIMRAIKGETTDVSRDLDTVINRTQSGSQSKRQRPDITGGGGRNRPKITGDVETSKPEKPEKEFKKFFDADKAKAEREKLVSKRKEYEIDRKGNITDRGVEKYARQMYRTNKPLTQAQLDKARQAAVGGAKITNEKGQVIGTTTGKYGGNLPRRRSKNAKTYDQVKKDIDRKEKKDRKPETMDRKPEGFIGDKPPEREQQKPPDNQQKPPDTEIKFPGDEMDLNKGYRKKRGAIARAQAFARRNPIGGYAGVELGKGIIGKLMKVKGAVPGVVGGTVGRRSARGGGGL